MVKITTRWKLSADINLLRGTSFLTKVKHYWRKGWVEIPVIMGSSFYTLAGISFIAWGIWYGETHDLTPKYHTTPKIYRPDDPEVKKIVHTSALDD